MSGAAETRPHALRPLPRGSEAPARSAILSVVIVNYCQWHNTSQLTKQLRHSDALHGDEANIVIVDNDSPTADVSARLASLPGVQVLHNPTNRGFAMAVNQGVRASTGDWVLLLNPDVTVEDGFLDEVALAVQKAEAADPNVGVVGFQLLDADGSSQPSVGHYPTLGSTLRGIFQRRSRRKCQHYSTEQRQSVDWVTGGCFLVRRECLESLGGFDERFFLYYEDVDFCRRAKLAGWSIWYDPSLGVTHHWPLHKRSVPAPLRLITRHALLRYAHKHWAPADVRVLRRVMAWEATSRGLLARLRGDRAAVACYRVLADLARGANDEQTKRAIAFAASFLRPIASAQDTDAVSS